MGVGAAVPLNNKESKMDIFWLFFMLSALQPLIKQKLLEASRKRLIALIERQRKSRVVLLVHRQETMSLLGFPLFRYIDINDSEEVLRAIRLTDPKIPLDLVLHTPGGLVLAATQIARAVFKHEGKVTVFVPHYAMSGGTLIALAADEIVMCEHAVLGPVDPQLGEYPAASILKAAHQKPIAEVDDKTLILADQAEKAVAQMRREVEELLRSEEHTSELQSRRDLVCRLLLEKKNSVSHSAIASALAQCRSIRTASVFAPRRPSHASSRPWPPPAAS